MAKHYHLPQLYYDFLRAIHESRAKRHDAEAGIPLLSNKQIFDLLDDRDELVWEESAQPAIRENALARMWNTVEWSTAAS